MSKIIPILALACLAHSAFAQSFRLEGYQAKNDRKIDLHRQLSEYSIQRVDANTLMEFVAQRQQFTIRLDLDGAPAMDASMAFNKVLADDYQTLEPLGKEMRKSTARPEVYTFRGIHTRRAGDRVALTIAKDFIYGFFEVDAQRYYIEPLWYFDKAQARDLYVVYNSDAVIQDKDIVCAPVEIRESEKQTPEGGSGHDPKGIPCKYKELEIAIANDFAMLQKYGTVANVLTHNIGVMNNVHTNYDTEFNSVIQFVIVTQWVSSSVANDPASGSTSSVILNQFKAWVQNGGFGLVTFDLAHLRMGRLLPQGGGMFLGGGSFMGAICADGFNFGFCSEYSDIACEQQKTAAHEIGHSFGAGHPAVPTNPHTIMDQGAFCSDLWASASVTAINSGIAGATCLSSATCTATPGFVTVPEELSSICTPDEYCFDLHLPCVGYFDIFTDDPNLTITTSGTAVCLKSTVDEFRTSRLYVQPYDYCGQPVPDVTSLWRITIDDPAVCPGIKGDEPTDERSAKLSGADSGLLLRQTNDRLIILDDNPDLLNKHIQIFDCSGRLVTTLEDAGTRIEIPLTNMPQGILLVRINAGQGSSVSKIYHF